MSMLNPPPPPFAIARAARRFDAALAAIRRNDAVGVPDAVCNAAVAALADAELGLAELIGDDSTQPAAVWHDGHLYILTEGLPDRTETVLKIPAERIAGLSVA